MWTIRFLLLGLSIGFLGASGYFLSRRQEYQNLLENGTFNFALVIIYSLLCYLMAGLPSDPTVFSPPGFFIHSGVRMLFVVIGWGMIGAAVIVMGITLRQRKSLGGQDIKAGLLTSGIYRYFRHPLYAAAIVESLGIALVILSWDGLLMMPAIIFVNTVEAIIEERYDVGRRFPSQYQDYRKRTRMFGPIRVWALLLGCLLAVAMIPNVG
jgi:protein-S-isoprenylcysteine O-methyltransferase Ste14